MALNTTLTAGIGADLTITIGSGSVTVPVGTSFSKTLANGTGASQADLVYISSRTLAASATENLDLAGGVTSVLGAAQTFAKVKALLFKAATGNTNDVIVGGHATAAFVGPFADADNTVAIKPGGVFMVAAPVGGWTVTATTADMIKVTNSAAGTSVSYDVEIVGTSA